VLIKVQFFWDVTMCQLDVSNEHCALTFSIKQSTKTVPVLLDLHDEGTMLFKMSQTIYQFDVFSDRAS